MDFSRESQTSKNTSEFDHLQRWSAWIIVEGSRSRKLGFPNIRNLFHRFSKLINITIICSPMLLIHFFWYFGKRRRFLSPAPTRFSPLLFIFLWILFLTKYDKIMSKNELKFAQKEVFCKRLRIEWNTRQGWSGFLDISDAYILFRVEVNAFQTGKSSDQVSAFP